MAETHCFETQCNSHGFEFLQTCVKCGYKVAGNGRNLFPLDDHYQPVLDQVEQVECPGECATSGCS